MPGVFENISDTEKRWPAELLPEHPASVYSSVALSQAEAVAVPVKPLMESHVASTLKPAGVKSISFMAYPVVSDGRTQYVAIIARKQTHIPPHGDTILSTGKAVSIIMLISQSDHEIESRATWVCIVPVHVLSK